MNDDLVMLLFRIGIIVLPSAAFAFAIGYMKGYSKGAKHIANMQFTQFESDLQHETIVTMPEAAPVKLTTRKRRAENELT